MKTQQNNEPSETQCQKIVAWLKRPGRTLTRTQAYKKWGFHTLNSRVSDINRRKLAHVKAEMIRLKSGCRIARYYIP